MSSLLQESHLSRDELLFIESTSNGRYIGKNATISGDNNIVNRASSHSDRSTRRGVAVAFRCSGGGPGVDVNGVECYHRAETERVR